MTFQGAYMYTEYTHGVHLSLSWHHLAGRFCHVLKESTGCIGPTAKFASHQPDDGQLHVSIRFHYCYRILHIDCGIFVMRMVVDQPRSTKRASWSTVHWLPWACEKNSKRRSRKHSGDPLCVQCTNGCPAFGVTFSGIRIPKRLHCLVTRSTFSHVTAPFSTFDALNLSR
jgi:hypothetical protein